MLLRVEGHRTELSLIKQYLPAPSPHGCSMRQLREAARACGLSLVGVRLKKSNRAPDQPIVAFLKGGHHGHYVMIRPVGHTGRLLQVLDLDDDPIVLDAIRLYASPEWTGLALIPARPNWVARIGWALLAGTAAWGLASLVVPRLRRRTLRLAEARQ
jgi:Peptidase C39 family